MLSPNFDEILGVGIDYITATSSRRASTDTLADFGHWLVSQEMAQGCKRGNYRAQGYRGAAAGRAAYGLGYNGTIVRLSSTCAAEYWQQLTGVAERVTRLDLQVTTRNERQCAFRIANHHKEAKTAPTRRGRKAQFKCFYGPQGAETLTIGSRSSERYGRIYDKGLESGEEQYHQSVRYELELHRESAMSAALHIDSQMDEQREVLALVSEFFSVHALRLGFYDRVSPQVLDRNHLRSQKSGFASTAMQSIPEHVRFLRYISVCIKPGIQRLLAAGFEQEVFSALGLGESVTLNAGALQPTP